MGGVIEGGNCSYNKALFTHKLTLVIVIGIVGVVVLVVILKLLL